MVRKSYGQGFSTLGVKDEGRGLFPVALVLLTLSLLVPGGASGQPIDCDGSFYLFTTRSVVGNSSMHRIRITPERREPVSELVKADLGYRVAAAGYSTFDKHIYVLEESGLEVLRVDAAGNVTNLGFPEGLETDMIYTAGAVSPDGRRFFITGKEAATGHDKILFSIGIGRSGGLRAGRVSILNEFNASIGDLAFDPVRGLMYGYDRTTNKLLHVNWISGQVVNYFSRSMDEVGHLGSLFFDRSGQLYGFGSSRGGGEENVFFDVLKTSGESADRGSGPEAKSSDGCGCPYTVRMVKRAVPARVLPCTEFLLQYEIINHAGRSYSYMDFRDTLPEGFTITGILKRPSPAKELSGVGSNILAITDMDLLLDTSRIIVRVAVGEDVPPGSYASQAGLWVFPQAFGETIYSDDPLTALTVDATVIEVISGEDIDLDPVVRPSCAGDGVTIGIDIPDAVYRWSTGDSTQRIFVKQPGWYGLTVTTGCDRFSDSIRIESIPEAPALDLGENQEIEPGRTLTLEGDPVFSSGDLRYRWAASGDTASLSCLDCRSPVVRPLISTTYFLTVTDEYGCSAVDSMTVKVLQTEKIFFPNAFSPDGDGNNDVFYFQGPSGTARVMWLRVFDRWGNLLFESRDGLLDDPAHGWDGRARGQVVSTGIYLWAAELAFPDGRRKVINGDLLLLQ